MQALHPEPVLGIHHGTDRRSAAPSYTLHPHAGDGAVQALHQHSPHGIQRVLHAKIHLQPLRLREVLHRGLSRNLMVHALSRHGLSFTRRSHVLLRLLKHMAAES